MLEYLENYKCSVQTGRDPQSADFITQQKGSMLTSVLCGYFSVMPRHLRGRGYNLLGGYTYGIFESI